MNILLGKPFGDFPNDPLERHVESLAAGLRRAGCGVQVVPFHALDQNADLYPGFTPPALVHVFHAVKGGFPGQKFAEANRLPLILTVVGTDIDVDLGNPVLKERIQNILGKAEAVVTPCEALAQEISETIPGCKKPMVIPPGLPHFPAASPGIRDQEGLAPDQPLVVSVGALSTVRNVAFLYPVLERVRETHPDIVLVMVGDPIDQAYSLRLQDFGAHNPHIRLKCNRTLEELLSWIKAADVVIDVSHAIDLPNFTQVAASLGRPVVIPDIGGWRAVFTDERGHPGKGTAFFYDTVSRPGDFRRIHDSEDCSQVVLKILADRANADRVAARAAENLPRIFAQEKESFGYLNLYRQILR